jgi:23S rRNA pseudouridine1911/1915/1917 synthase
MQTFLVTTDQTAKRLDVALVELMGLTRSQVQKLIIDDLVKVNGKLPKKAGDLVSVGDTITVQPKETLEEKTKRMDDAGELMPVKKAIGIPRILAATPDFIVVEKPSGMLTHPTQAGETDTLADFIVKKYPEVKKVGDDTERPGIVHRLDKEASGLLVIARTQAMFEHLKNQFKNRTIGKHYFALVHDPMPRLEDTISFPIERSENADRMSALPKTEKGLATEKGKEALTEFEVIKNFVNFSLIDVNIHTGRMHQIRAHFFAYNHPVVGDPLYVQKKRPRTWDNRCGRLFLHSYKLSFVDLEGLPQEFEVPLPQELEQFLTQIA